MPLFLCERAMLNFLDNIFPKPDLDGLNLKSRFVDFSLNRLKTGVDNIRYDVSLSAEFSESVRHMVRLMLARHADAEDMLTIDESSPLLKEKERFNSLCQDIFLGALNRAKSGNEVQIDVLAQAAVIRLILDQMQDQFRQLVERFKSAIREAEMARNQEQALSLKQRMTDIGETRNRLMRAVGEEVFRCLPESQTDNADEIRRINFGKTAVIPEFILPNPMLCVDDPKDDMFILDEYEILLGHRVEDPDRYITLLDQLANLLTRMSTNGSGSPLEISPQSAGFLLMDEANIDDLFNHYQLQHECVRLKREGDGRESLCRTKGFMRRRKLRLKKVYAAFRRNGVIRRIVGIYEMQPLYRDYCPPLVPQLMLQFLISFRGERGIINRIKRLKRFYGKNLTLGPLFKARQKLWFVSKRTRQAHLIRFLKDFSRYHKDRFYYERVREAVDKVHLITDPKILQLSRANNCLYEFLLPNESSDEEKPILRHVIVKADVRGSTDITHRMLKRKLNPASYFSLNLFDPISDVLPEFGASKVFVEGDAIILSIFERAETPEGWYAVARACGLATRILTIVKRCNAKNRKYDLPIIELGIGISYKEGAPTFLFDGDHRIMISSAINLADRLSGCSKPLRKKLESDNMHFNLHVFQSTSEEVRAKTADDLSLRYNVNGIELNAEGFEKLKSEIDLKSVKIRLGKGQEERVRMYTGKYPLATGGYQRLVIRASRVRMIDPETLEITEKTRRTYYEVCTSKKVIERVREYVKKKA